jgi:hypothetical protein
MDVRKVSNVRNWMTESEVRVTMLVYADRRALEVSGGGIGTGAPAWFSAAADLAFRAV